MNVNPMIPPGSTLGVFGGGQLGRMFAVAAAQMGYRILVYAPQADCPASHVAAEHVRAAYDDDEQVVAFARRCDAITIEFENVPVRCLELAGRHAPTRPGPTVLAIAQDRSAERQFLDEHNLPSAPHRTVTSPQQLRDAVSRVGTPGVLKSAREGYDGKGQVRISADTDLEQAWRGLGIDRGIYERWVDHQCELSVLVARSARGEMRTFGPIRNSHRHHILDLSSVPAEIDPGAGDRAVSLAVEVAGALNLEGLICVEMFLTRDGQLLINELAPRPHNSGHLTIEASTTSQFEQQVRAVCNLPLGTMRLRSPAAMVNLLGDCWQTSDGMREPDWEAALTAPDAHLHLYGKADPRPGRKMGHLTVLAATPREAATHAHATRQRIARACTPSSPHRTASSTVPN